MADLYQIDLMDVSGLSSHNDGSRYLLTCIEVFSKQAWAVPVRGKTGQNVAEAFEKILVDGNCNMLQSDKGTEFLNLKFQSMLRRRGIKFYTSENQDLKAVVVERFNRTLRRKCFALSLTRIRDATWTSSTTCCIRTITRIIVPSGWHRPK